MDKVKEKICSQCGKKKLLSEFYKDKTHKDGFRFECKECNKKYTDHPDVRVKRIQAVKKYRKTEKGKIVAKKAGEKWHKKNGRNYHLKNTYGLTLEQYDEMFEQQNGVCAICGNTNGDGRRFCVDHNHETGKIRALLCGGCNFKLGIVEDINFVTKAKKYLKEHKNEREI